MVNSDQIIEVKCKGKFISNEPVDVVHSLASLKPHPGTISGDPDALVHIDWSDQWQPVSADDSEALW